ncbi:hypothetical protein HDU98_003669 [Podochytrium sp. JEL0797]|nr:hypothetical protein HDU98_003669 [Podochytrium sp. JEL0797]
MVVVTDSGYSFRIKLTNMENKDGEELGEEGGDDLDEMDVDVEHEIGGDDAGEANMLEGEGDPPIPELGPDPVPNPPEYSSLEVTLSTPGSALFFGSLSMMASSQAIDSSEVATAVAKISTSRNHRWPLHLDQKSDNCKLNNPAATGPEKKKESLLLPDYKPTLFVGTTVVTLEVAALQRPKLLPTDDTHHLGLKTSDSQDYIFKPMQIQYLEREVLLLHIPLALAETSTPENAKPIPVSPPVKMQLTCTDGNCLDCFTPRSFRPKAVPPALPSNTTHTDWQLLIWEEGKSPECLKSFHAAGEIEVRWNLNPKPLAPGTPCVIAADPGLKTPFVFVDNHGNIYRLVYRHMQLIKYCYDCIAALESECDQRVNAMDAGNRLNFSS